MRTKFFTKLLSRLSRKLSHKKQKSMYSKQKQRNLSSTQVYQPTVQILDLLLNLYPLRRSKVEREDLNKPQTSQVNTLEQAMIKAVITFQVETTLSMVLKSSSMTTIMKWLMLLIQKLVSNKQFLTNQRDRCSKSHNRNCDQRNRTHRQKALIPPKMVSDKMPTSLSTAPRTSQHFDHHL